nr:dna2 helicase [Hymenolepis microstoma]
MSGKSAPTREVLFNSIIKPSIILQLYGLGDSPEEFCSSVQVFLPKIDQWVKEHCSLNSQTTLSNRPTIKEVVDIEENIWCTKIGVKGKIDMTVMCQTAKELDCGLMPLELKTGKPSFSFEHQGQVLLYVLMLSDRHSDHFQDVAKHGWLVYLRQPDQRQTGRSDLVKPQASSFRGLIQARNRLAASLKRLIALDDLIPEEGKESAKWRPQLPSPLDRERVCSWCPYLLTCGLFRGESTPPPIDTQLHQMLNDRIKHVKTDHKTFLLHWTRLQLLEYANSNRVDKVLACIADSTNETASGAIRGLIVESTTQSADDSEFTVNMAKQNGGQITIQGMSLGGFLIVSSDDSRHVGLCLATLKTISSSSRSLTICTDRPLPQWVTRFRLDRYFSDKAVRINLSNLVGLMENSRICAQLRQLVIDQTCPRFTHSLKKSTLLDVRRFLRPLNIHQRRAVLSVLMSKDYTLIEGFPGSGKTETLAALLRCLAVLGKRTLLISHTHSAVDNVLLRLTTDSDVKFVRLGAPDKIHYLLRPHNLETLLSKQISSNVGRSDPSRCTALCSQLVKYVDEVMTQATLVGCTALAAADHEALARRKFEVVVVDEATQLLLPTALGGLLKMEPDSSQFVLVGDENQLPPLVQSSVARGLGFGTSLFAHLSHIVQRQVNTPVPEEADSLGSCLVQLKAQYRMNSHILRLVNTLFYNGAMECASDEVANRTLELNQSIGESTNWLNRVLTSKMEDSVIFLDTQSICKQLGGNSNLVEIDIVHKVVIAFTKRGVSTSDIGVIAPYRVQVDSLIDRLRGDKCIETDLVPSSPAVEVNTADQFQGRDKPLIIVSFVDCLRHRGQQTNADADNKRSSSLLDDAPRLNVALTRAKCKLVLIGCAGEHSRSNECKINKEGSVLEQMITVLQEMSSIVPVPSL